MVDKYTSEIYHDNFIDKIDFCGIGTGGNSYISVIYKTTYSHSYSCRINNTISEFENMVGGPLAAFPFPGMENIYIICNANGRLDNLKCNIYLKKIGFIPGDLLVTKVNRYTKVPISMTPEDNYNVFKFLESFQC